MKCVRNEVLQAYIDGELDIEQKKHLEKHLLECQKCNEVFKVLKANDDFVFGKVSRYKQYYEEVPEPAVKYFTPEPEATDTPTAAKGVLYTMFQHKKAIAVACIAVTAAVCITVQPVRAAISNALSIFRVEDVKGIKISLSDIQEIQRKISMNEPEISMDQMGKIKMQGGQHRKITAEEAKSLADFKVLLPPDNPKATPNISTVEPATVDFTLNVSNVNNILRTFGAKKLFPQTVDGKTFTAGFSRQVRLDYADGGKYYTMTQMKPPQLSIPDGVNMDELYSSVVELPILPENLQKQLKSIKDWKSTLYIPVVESQMKEVQVGEATGYLQTTAAIETQVQTTNGTVNMQVADGSRNQTHSSLIWMQGGVLYTLQGSLTPEEALNIAKSLK